MNGNSLSRGGVKDLRFQGSNVSKLARLIQDIGYNSEARLRFGKIIATSPLRIELFGSSFVAEQDDLKIPDYLREHTRQVDISGLDGTRTMTVQSPLETGQSVAMIQYPTEYGFSLHLIGIIR